MLACTAAFAPLALGAGGAVVLYLALFAATSIAAIIAYALLTHLVPPAQTGRVTTASNLVMFGTSFAFQWGVGAILGLWPGAQGRYDPEGYRVAFGVLLAAQAAAAAWLLTAKSAVLALLVDDLLRAAVAGADDLAFGLLVGLDHVERELVDAVLLDLALDLGLQLPAVLLLSQGRTGKAIPTTTAAAISFTMSYPLLMLPSSGRRTAARPCASRSRGRGSAR